MKVECLTPLLTTPTRPGYVRTVEPFIVRLERLGRSVNVPTGFEFDRDSVPRWPLIYVTLKDRLPLEAAAVHDWLYDGKCPGVTRHEADLVMLDIAKAKGLAWHWRWPIYAGVRLGGWMGWRP